MEVSATGPEPHLDLSALQRNVLLLEVSTLQGPELHLDVSALQRSVLLLEVSATGPELNLDVSALGRYVSNPQGPVHTYCRSVRFPCLFFAKFGPLKAWFSCLKFGKSTLN